MEARARKRGTWWASSLLGYRFIIIALVLQLLLISYMLWSYASPTTTKNVVKKATSSPVERHLLFIGIFSSRQSAEQRQAVRETWLKFPHKGSVKYKFIVGSPNLDDNLDVIQQEFKLNEEIEFHKDILKVDVVEDQVTSNSEKLWSTYAWLRDNVQFQYFLKIDHDSFLRLDLLADELSQRPSEKSVWTGFVWKQEAPNYGPIQPSFKLVTLPPYTSRETFYVSYDVVYGLSEARPNLFLPDEGQSMAVWLLPYSIIPKHEPRFPTGDACAKEMLSKSNLTPQYMLSIHYDTFAYQDPCIGFNRETCPVCFECEPEQPHWKLKGFQCDHSGATKVKSEKVARIEEVATKGIVGFLPLLQCTNRLLEDVDAASNFVKGGKSPDSNQWEFTGSVKVEEGEESGMSSVSVSVSKTGPAASYITQEIKVGQKQAEPVLLSAWSKANNVGNTEVGDYCLLADVTFADGKREYAITVDYQAGTHDWEYNFKIFDPPKPIESIMLRGMLRVTTGTAWFSNISVRNITASICDLKHQSQYFGSFRPATLPDWGTHLHNRFITTGAIPREAKLGIASGREGLVDYHIHTDEDENGETSAQHTVYSSGERFVVVWTSPANTFKLRNRRVIESIFFHHPDAHLIVYSNVLPLYFFHEFNSAGYDVQVERYNLKELSEELPGSSWVEDLDKWEKGEYFYSHLSDFLRLLILYRYGGIYTDLDSILLRPINKKNLVVAEVCSSGGCSQDGDKTIKSKYYVPTGFMAFTANHQLLLDALSLFETDYDPTVRHCGSMYLSMAYTKQAEAEPEVSVMSVKSFYPIPESEIVKYFTSDNPERWQAIATGDSYAFHFWGTLTHDTRVAKSSLMWRALNSFSISNQRNKPDLRF